MKNDQQLIVNCYSSVAVLKSTENNETYKIIEIISGGGFARVGHYVYLLCPGDLIFLHPNTDVAWDLKNKSIIHHCEIKPDYLADHQYLLKQFRDHPHFNPSSALIILTYQQALAIGMVFKMIRQEVIGQHDDKKQAILLHVQMLLLLAKRASNKVGNGLYRTRHLCRSINLYHLIKPLLNEENSWKNN